MTIRGPGGIDILESPKLQARESKETIPQLMLSQSEQVPQSEWIQQKLLNQQEIYSIAMHSNCLQQKKGYSSISHSSGSDYETKS
ncbi:hypothetical protein HK100_007297 [Physocladia obscura]|uniref:Uncharacterized protein n=1 Tax=Physocladia obscura TaxID=109957 RepID=A0AAD5XK37_9FUNG|nr:hypothetical protein HK100_007297 [Physocladia obscura]